MEQRDLEIIEAAQSLLDASPRLPSSRTIERYDKAAVRLLEAGIETPEALAQGYPNPRTYYHHRAAIQAALRQMLSAFLQAVDRAAKAEDGPTWRAQLDALSNTLAILVAFEQAPPDLLRLVNDGPPPRKTSKRQSLPRGEWRQALCAVATKMRSPGAAEVLETLALTGCRPEELVRGVLWRLASDQLIAEVEGAKTGEHAGQPWRRLTIIIQGPVADALASRVAAAGGHLRVTAPTTRRLDKWIRAADRKAFPQARRKPISAYSFRHQLAADWKAQGLPDAEVGGALGHRTDAMCRQYGHRHQGGHGGCVSLLSSVETALDVKHKPRGANAQIPTAAPSVTEDQGPAGPAFS